MIITKQSFRYTITLDLIDAREYPTPPTEQELAEHIASAVTDLDVVPVSIEVVQHVPATAPATLQHPKSWINSRGNLVYYAQMPDDHISQALAFLECEPRGIDCDHYRALAAEAARRRGAK